MIWGKNKFGIKVGFGLVRKDEKRLIEVDPEEMAYKVISEDLDTSSLDVDTAFFESASNSIVWSRETRFAGAVPFPRQTEALVNLFEDYCPICSNMEIVNPRGFVEEGDKVKGMWGLSHEEIIRKVSLLEYGVCPRCKKTKVDFRKLTFRDGKAVKKTMDAEEPLVKNFHEVIGVAGMRCLHPDTLLIRANSSRTPLSTIRVGDELASSTPIFKEGSVERFISKPTRVRSISKSYQPGYFIVTFLNFDNTPIPIICGDSHLWLIHTNQGDRLISTADLKVDHLVCSPNVRTSDIYWRIIRIEKVEKPLEFIDIETDNNYFMHDSGLLLHNSGKTVLAGLISSYILHRYLMLPGVPAKYFGLMPGATLHMTFVAVDLSQAHDTLWQSFRDIFDSATWFEQYNSYLDEQRTLNGSELYKTMTTYVAYKNKRISIAFAPARKGLRGRTRIMGGIDELGWFEESRDAKVSSGPETYIALTKSLRTIRGAADRLRSRGVIDPPDGYMVNISSPKHESDPIMTQFGRKNSRAYKFKFATWDFNPDITRESLRSESENDPLAFARDYGAEPPAAADFALAHPGKLDDLVRKDIKIIAATRLEKFSETIGSVKYSYFRRELIDCLQDRRIPRVLTGDAGETASDFGLLISHWDRLNGYAVIDLVVEIEPKLDLDGSPITVHFPSVEKLIVKLSENLNIKCVAFDRWNSTHLIQNLRDRKIIAEQVSLVERQFKEFSDNIDRERWRIPAPEPNEGFGYDSDRPISTLITQAKTSRRMGRQYKKPSGGKDDLFRCWVLADVIISKYPHLLTEYALPVRGMMHAQTHAIMRNRNTVSMQPRIGFGLTQEKFRAPGIVYKRGSSDGS